MQGTEFGELTAFVAIADHGNFSKAAAALGLSTSTVSQTIRSLEERLGVRLLNRTTRSVALTEAGDRLLQQINPALAELGAAVESVTALSDTPAGVLRLSVASLAVGMVIDPVLPEFRAAYPDITLDIAVDDSLIDIVGGRFDAGIRIGSRIEQDMVASRVSPDSRLIAVASPSYLAANGRPDHPSDLRLHNCIRFRQTTGAIHKWGFENGDEKLEIAVKGSLITNNPDLVVRAALNGVGISYMHEEYMSAHIASGRLVPVLEDWSLPFAGFHLFYPSRRQMAPKLKAFSDFLRAAIRKTAAPRPRLAAIAGATPAQRQGRADAA
jgi:DNA-binding transcriptional LysR family regulator